MTVKLSELGTTHFQSSVLSEKAIRAERQSPHHGAYYDQRHDLAIQLQIVRFSRALWDTKSNKNAGKSVAVQRTYEKLENIKTNIGKHYQHICDRNSYATAEKVKNP